MSKAYITFTSIRPPTLACLASTLPLAPLCSCLMCLRPRPHPS